MTRLPDWPERLAAYIASYGGAKFALGQNDCALFAAGAVHAVTGARVLPAVWHDKAQAVRMLRMSRGLVAGVDHVLPRLAGPQWAQRGDVVLVQGPAHRRWLAVVDSARWWAPSADGLASGPIAQAVLGWGVGHG